MAYGPQDHQSRRDSERVNYQRLRDAGANHDYARSRAERASELAHRSQDRINSDRKG